MKRILLFGAGKSASVLIAYLVKEVQDNGWHVTVVDANLELIHQKLQGAPGTEAASFDIENKAKRKEYIAQADIVISLLPPALHRIVAQDCLACKKNLLTASYVDEEMKKLQTGIVENGLLFLCEMGLDPGIDHMSAKQMIDSIQDAGGQITTFISHCGGLVAPESDDNPWHYKISWNPRNVVLAGKAGAVYRKNNQEKRLDYNGLFSEKRFVDIYGGEPLCWYPNRNSLPYINLYGLQQCSTFIRTTLRHPDFMFGWKNIIDLQLTDETVQYKASKKSLKDLFKEHLDKHKFNGWLEQRFRESFSKSKTSLAQLRNLSEKEQEASAKGTASIEEFMLVHEEGAVKQVNKELLKYNAPTASADRLHDADLIVKQLFFLGLDDSESKIDKDVCSAADILQYALEKKLVLNDADKDMVVMKHEIEFQRQANVFKHTSTLIVKGENNQQTAMAKTVGLPLGIATKLILNGTITCTGLHIPTSKEIYEPVLRELANYGIVFFEEKEQIL